MYSGVVHLYIILVLARAQMYSLKKKMLLKRIVSTFSVARFEHESENRM